MNTVAGKVHQELPKTDLRVKVIAAKLKKENYQREALIAVLLTSHTTYAYLPSPAVFSMGLMREIPRSRF